MSFVDLNAGDEGMQERHAMMVVDAGPPWAREQTSLTPSKLSLSFLTQREEVMPLTTQPHRETIG